MRKLELHWKILIGLAIGLVVGVICNLAWGPRAWERVGVDHVPAYFAGKDTVAVLPEGISSALELDPTDQSLRGLSPHELSAQQIEKLGLETRPVNQDAGLTAALVWFTIKLNAFVGDLFIRSLFFIAVPIVLFSLITGASSLNDLRKLSRIGGKTVVIYLCTTAVAITVGLTLANIVRPGRFVPQEIRDDISQRQLSQAEARLSGAESPDIWETFLNLVPRNPFQALAEASMLQVVFTALIIGIALTLIPKEKADPIIRFCDGMTDVVIKIVHIVLKIAPVAVFALIAKVVAELGLDVLGALIVYSAVVIAGLLIMILGVYPAILLILTKRQMGYARFFRGIAPAQMLAFSSSSSGATLPVTMECAEERLGVSEEVSSFVLPLGATINMDGTALYQGVAALFIAQMFGIPLDLGAQLTIILTATLASIGTAAVPSAGLIMLIIVLESVRMPPDVVTKGIAIIFAVDRLLDMSRTVCNITGDAMVASSVAASEGDLLTADEVEQRRRQQEAVGLDEHPCEGEQPHFRPE